MGQLTTRRFAIGLFKTVVLGLTLIALAGAMVQAVDSWREQAARVGQQIAELTQAAERVGDVASRRGLLARRDALLASQPAWHNLKLRWLGLASVFYAIGLLPNGIVLHETLAVVGIRCSWGRAMASQLLGHAGKYVPGKAMVVVLRAWAVLPPEGVEAVARSGTRAGTAVVLETLLMMSVGAAWSGILVGSAPLPAWVKLTAAAMAVAAAIPTLPPILSWVASRLQKKTASERDDSGSPAAALSWGALARCWAWCSISWWLIGASMLCLIWAIPWIAWEPSTAAFGSVVAPPEVPVVRLWAIATSAISLGMVLGFASLLPGGAGVREWTTLVVLTPTIGPNHALLCVIAARLTFIATEAVLALASLAMLTRWNRTRD